MHAGTACSHCMREGDSGFRFQNAERQRHAAVVAQGETGPQAVCGHPPCAAARKAVFRSAAFQPDGLDLAEGERPCKAGARRLEEGFLRGKTAGTILVFISSLGMFVVPDVMGGAKSALIGNLIQNQFLSARDWPFGSALSIVLAVLSLVLIILYYKALQAQEGGDGDAKDVA